MELTFEALRNSYDGFLHSSDVGIAELAGAGFKDRVKTIGHVANLAHGAAIARLGG